MKVDFTVNFSSISQVGGSDQKVSKRIIEQSDNSPNLVTDGYAGQSESLDRQNPLVSTDSGSFVSDKKPGIQKTETPSWNAASQLETFQEQEKDTRFSPASSTFTALESTGSGFRTNSNGTIAIFDDTTSTSSTDSTGEVNFARLFGVETGSSDVPKNFTIEEVERHYFTHSPSEPGSRVELSENGLKLYETVKTKYLDSVPKCPYGSPTLTLTGGLPGSGKGYILSTMMGENPQFVLVDPDEIKKDILQDLVEKNPQLPQQMAGDKLWNNVIHETSSVMAKMLMQDALGSGKDIVFDSSMATGNVDKYRKFAETARSNGYQVAGIISSVTVDTAVNRALKRADVPTVVPMKDGSSISLPGRLTPRNYIEDCSSHLQNNLETYLSEGLYDHCTVFDNSVDNRPPERIGVYERKQTSDGRFQCVPREVEK